MSIHLPCRLLRGTAALALLALSSLPASADPVFGPATYVRTTGPSNVFNETVTPPGAGRFVLFVQNGDDGANLVSSGSIEVNGTTVVSTADLSSTVELISRGIVLSAGTNTLRVTLDSAPGSQLTVFIVPRLERPDATIGRLLLPHATSGNLVIDLKNAAHRPRAVRLVFFDESGGVVGSSNRIVLAPHASLSSPVAALIANGSWTEGSIEIGFAGPGPGGVHGQAAFTEPTSGLGSIVPLQLGGFRRLEPPPPPLPQQ
jgi:hypothetical protein